MCPAPQHLVQSRRRLARYVRDVWANDFVPGRDRRGGPIGILNFVDEYVSGSGRGVSGSVASLVQVLLERPALSCELRPQRRPDRRPLPRLVRLRWTERGELDNVTIQAHYSIEYQFLVLRTRSRGIHLIYRAVEPRR